MRVLLLSISLILSLLFFFSCSSEKENENDIPNQTTSISRDSLRGLYKKYTAQAPNTFPTRQVYERGKLNPVDEAPLDTAFYVFRGQLLEAVRNKDILALMEIVDENIKVDFGSAGGPADFIKTWQLKSEEQVQNSRLWPLLEDVLVNGGTFSDGRTRFTAPYFYATFPDEYDAFTHGVIAGAGVRFRESPDLSSGVLRVVSYDIVKILNGNGPEQTIGGELHPWMEVRRLNDEQGWIWGKFIKQPIDFRAGFEKRNGQWKMTFFIAGD